MSMTLAERRIRGYMLSIYIDGTRSFDGYNGKEPIGVEFHVDVKTCAAGLLTIAQIDDANGARISEQEYLDTLALVGTPAAIAWKSK